MFMPCWSDAGLEDISFKSSANAVTWMSGGNNASKSFIYIKKRKGPVTLPCGTPERMLIELDDTKLSIFTTDLRFLRKERIH
uniref:Uncharacterized protein n=1 Tax=Caenorhabditis japonica TaxID=281687 RepID=A0A8R1J3A5_CAEJA